MTWDGKFLECSLLSFFQTRSKAYLSFFYIWLKVSYLLLHSVQVARLSCYYSSSLSYKATLTKMPPLLSCQISDDVIIYENTTILSISRAATTLP